VVYGINNIIFCLFLLVSITIFVCLSANNAYAHISQDNKTAAPIQEWNSTQDNVKIQFGYIPEKPLVYTETNLIFSIQDLTTGNHIKDLSLKVRFLEDGYYQVISQISSTDNNIALALASFNLYIPLQPAGKFNVDSLISSLIPAGWVAIGLSAIMAVLILILRKRGKAEKGYMMISSITSVLTFTQL
jgi:hypothetical protein